MLEGTFPSDLERTFSIGNEAFIPEHVKQTMRWISSNDATMGTAFPVVLTTWRIGKHTESEAGRDEQPLKEAPKFDLTA